MSPRNASGQPQPPWIPRRKSVFPAAKLVDGRIHIGGVDRRHAAVLEDPDGQVWELLSLLDGKHTLDEVADRFRLSWPTVSAAEVFDAVARLASEGYVEDAGVRPPATSPGGDEQRDLGDRYLRNRDFLSFYSVHPTHGTDLQASLRKRRVTVLGLGGLGAAMAATRRCGSQ